MLWVIETLDASRRWRGVRRGWMPLVFLVLGNWKDWDKLRPVDVFIYAVCAKRPYR